MQPGVLLPRTSLFARIFRLRTIKSGTPSKLVDTQARPVYQRVPPWWARWAVALVACDVFTTASVIELTWNHWSQLVSDLEKISIKNKSKEEENASKIATPSAAAPGEEERYELRPTWHRLGLCASHMFFGVGVAVALLVAQARFVRTIAILDPAKPAQGRQVFIQCAHNWRNHGITFPLNLCSLQEGRNESEMVLRVSGERGHWHIGLGEAFIHGRRASTLDARDAILEEWKDGKRHGKWTLPSKDDGKWKSGPIVRQG